MVSDGRGAECSVLVIGQDDALVGVDVVEVLAENRLGRIHLVGPPLVDHVQLVRLHVGVSSSSLISPVMIFFVSGSSL